MPAISAARLIAAAIGGAMLGTAAPAQTSCGGSPSPCAQDFAINYPEKRTTPPDTQGSTHEITVARPGNNALWLTAPNYSEVVSVSMTGTSRFHPLPDKAMPHGIAFDRAGNLWVTFEHVGGHMSDHGGEIARLDAVTGKVLARYPVLTDPHGLGIGPDGRTVWFTGKTKGTVGYLTSNGKPVNYQLANKAAYPIYIVAGPDKNMWFTELQASKIGRVTPAGKIDEFRIPTDNSRPIAIIPDPDPKVQALWFSEEAGNKVARIDMKGNITEFAVPPKQHDPQPNYILAGLAFDTQGNLWTQQYVAQTAGNPPGPDYIVMIGKSVRKANAGDRLDYTYYEVPTRNTVMHRIIQGPDMNIWYTELKADKIGRISLKNKAAMK